MRRDAVVTDYLKRENKIQLQTLVLVDTNAEKEAITTQIRKGLIEREKLGKDSLQIPILKPKVLDKFSHTQASSYQVGDVIKFGRNSALFDAKLYYQVDEVDSKNSIVKLRDKYGSIQSIELNRYKDREVFQSQTLEVRSGEVMKFTRNQYRNKLKPINGQQFTILGFEDDGRVVIKTKGKTQTVTPESLLYSDYRYVDTVHSSRGKTANYCIYAAGSGNSLTVSKESFSVATSRARKEFTVYTVNSQALGISVTKSRGQENALPPINNQKPARSSEFKLLVAAKYLVEQQGKLNSSKPLEKIYQSLDGTTIKRDKNSLTITQGNKKLQFDNNNATVKNIFSTLEIESQIKARTMECMKILTNFATSRKTFVWQEYFQHQLPVVIFSLEMTKKDIEYRLWCLMSKLDCYQHLNLAYIKCDRLRQYQADLCSLTETEMNSIVSIAEIAAQLPFYINDNRGISVSSLYG